jgi:hypothetical protein
MVFFKNRKSNNPFFFNPGRTHSPRWAGPLGCTGGWQGKKIANRPDSGGPAVRTELNRNGIGVIFLVLQDGNEGEDWEEAAHGELTWEGRGGGEGV